MESAAYLTSQRAVCEKQNYSGLEGFYVADCVDFMTAMPDECIDLAVTSPPYDNLRDYKGYSFEFEQIADGLFRVIKEGGVLVWVVGDKINGGRSLTSFR
ncbi:MAG: site-specific DNA-methyltransferase, partial [Fibromonadaceae bacterium]|nr:site-specific DNA-methyltransferase [Fibromonadaceae bacterium]